MALLFFKAHPVTQAMTTAAKPEELDFGQVRRNPGEPSPEQAASGKYNKPRIEWRGLTIAVENPAGSVRRGMNRHGISWEMRMKYDYGEVVGSCGVDGDPVDIYMGPNLDAPMVYVVHQRRVNDWQAYDEDKAMAGFDSEEDAKQAFLSCYTDPRFLGPITAMPVEEFVAKVRATKEKPAMIKSLLVFSKAHVGPYLRGGKLVNLSGYQGRNAQAHAAAGQLDMFAKPSKPLGPNPYKGKDPVVDTIDMFGGEPTHTEPTADLVQEHKRLVAVLRSPSHEDDKVEAKKQAEELAELEGEADSKKTVAASSKKINTVDVDNTERERAMGSVIGEWAVGQRSSGKFTAWIHYRRDDGSIGVHHMQDERTGEDALFDSEKEALDTIRAVTSPRLLIS